MTQSSIHQLINLRNEIIILWACFIEINIVNIYPLVSIRLFNMYNVGELLGVLHIEIKPCS